MFKRLRGRLLASYVAIISITLCVIGLALWLLLLRNPLPARMAYIRLRLPLGGISGHIVYALVKLSNGLHLLPAQIVQHTVYIGPRR